MQVSSSESQVERLQGLQRTSTGEISFLRARLDFHLTASDAVAKRDAAKLAQIGEGDAAGADAAMAEGDEVPEAAQLQSEGNMATLQSILDETRKQVDQLEISKKVCPSTHSCAPTRYVT